MFEFFQNNLGMYHIPELLSLIVLVGVISGCEYWAYKNRQDKKDEL